MRNGSKLAWLGDVGPVSTMSERMFGIFHTKITMVSFINYSMSECLFYSAQEFVILDYK